MTPGEIMMRLEGIGRCHHGHHPVLLFREVGGLSDLTLRIDEGEARLLAGEREGQRSRHSRTYETLLQVIAALGGTVAALELVGDRQRGLSGAIELAHDRWRVRVQAHPGDVAALAWRLRLPVRVPVEVTSAPRAENWEWCLDSPCETVADPDEIVAFRRFLEEAGPEAYDW